MLEIVEIIRPAKQGRTTPFLCNASDGYAYFVKGYAATVAGLMREWVGAHLAKSFGLPVPPFAIVYLDERLANAFGGLAVSELKGGYVFASRQVHSANELKFETVKKIDLKLKLRLIIFDLWVQNGDRILTETGGNPNLLWKADESGLYVIDHNLIFEQDFDKPLFWNTHVFKSDFINIQIDWIERNEFECLMQKSIENWQLAMDTMPVEWLEFNDEFNYFAAETHLQRLKSEANGSIWAKML